MKRRDFLKTSLVASSFAGLGTVASTVMAAEGRRNPPRQEYYELRLYLDPRRKLVDEYWGQAAIPALNRLSIRPVGVFCERENSEKSPLYVLIPYPSIQAFATVAARLAKDEEYQKAGANYLNPPKAEPAYARVESSLLLAFAGMPKIELPPFSAEKKPRMFELRIYESHCEFKGQKKVDMFNSGEIEVMRQTELGPVFFGQSVVGSKLPNLTYMLAAENEEAHKKHWAAFGAHPEWNRMKGLPEYADTVSQSTNKFLIPTPYSQI